LNLVGPDTAPPEAARDGSKSVQQAMPGYKGLVRLTDQALIGGMGKFLIAAGMQLTAEIVEGDRTVMQYLLSPVRRMANEAGRER
jgi:hemolysin D